MPFLLSILASVTFVPKTLPPVQAIEAPDGWRRVEMKEGQVGFAPTDLPQGKVAGIILWPEESATGDLKAWFVKKAPTMGANGGEFQEAGGIVFTSGVNKTRPFLLAAVRPAGAPARARVAMLFGDADVLKRYNDGFSDLLLGIRTGRRGGARLR